MKVTQLCLTLAIPWTVAHKVPLSMGFSRQEYWSGLPFPSLGIFPIQESNPCLLHCRQICDPMDCYSPWNSLGQNSGVGSLFPFSRGSPNPGIKPRSPALQADSLPAEPQGKPGVSKVQQKTCSLGEQRTRAPSILTLS